MLKQNFNCGMGPSESFPLCTYAPTHMYKSTSLSYSEGQSEGPMDDLLESWSIEISAHASSIVLEPGLLVCVNDECLSYDLLFNENALLIFSFRRMYLKFFFRRLVVAHRFRKR